MASAHTPRWTRRQAQAHWRACVLPQLTPLLAPTEIPSAWAAFLGDLARHGEITRAQAHAWKREAA